MRGARRALGVTAALVAGLLSADPALALFSRQRPVTANVFATGTLQPASGLVLAESCPVPGADYLVTISWTASPSSFVQGYRVEWADDVSGAPGAWALLSTPTASPTQQNGVPRKSDRWYRVKATAYSWSSGWITGFIAIPAKPC